MTPALLVGIVSLVAVLALIALRIPIGVALGLVGLAGFTWLRGFDVALGNIAQIPFETAANWGLSAIPMFILMGSIAFNSGLSESLFRAARLWLSGLPGGLAVATNVASAAFGAASGSSVAAAATMSRVAIPEMLKHGYDKGLAAGCVASAGTLAALIPPSVMFVLYGVFAQVSITKLLIAGVLPGLLTAGAYTALIVIRCALDPALAPKLAPAERADLKRERWAALVPIWPLLVLMAGMIGGLYGGIFTATEAGAAGAFLALVVAATQGRLNYAMIKKSVFETVTTTGQIFFIAIGAVLYTRFLGLAGLSDAIHDVIGSWALNPTLLIIAASVVYIILGMFLDPLGILLITLPVLQPMFDAVHADPIWVGVIVVKYIEIGLLTPPVGFNVYIVKSVVGDTISLETIFRGVGWFLVAEFFTMVLLIVFPSISTVLPNAM
jgi:C4-dicarboxylate transporter DctM subunit